VAVMSDRVWQASLDETLHAAHTSVADYDDISREVLCHAKKRLRCIATWIVYLERDPLGLGVDAGRLLLKGGSSFHQSD
jgi:hypothetical protein